MTDVLADSVLVVMTWQGFDNTPSEFRQVFAYQIPAALVFDPSTFRMLYARAQMSLRTAISMRNGTRPALQPSEYAAVTIGV
jgi:hypothetical protein